MTRQFFRFFLISLAVTLGLVVFQGLSQSSVSRSDCSGIARKPNILPDYSDTVIPPNIAPLNFYIKEPASKYQVTILSDACEPVVLTSSKPVVEIPLRAWRNLLEANRGNDIVFRIFARNDSGAWSCFEDITNSVANEEIDSCLAYRLIGPVYNMWKDMGIYQRDLETYRERAIVENTPLDLACINCHTFDRNRPNNFVFQLRSGTYGRPMMMAFDGEVSAVDTTSKVSQNTAIYSSWHPRGDLIAISGNKITQFFHTRGMESREVFDHYSDLILYQVHSNTVTTTKEICQDGRMETYPNWSADGKHLYFCSAPKLPIQRYKEVKYDLMRIPYDIEANSWGALETIVSASDTAMSCTHPKPSPDGKYILFCMCDHGNFSILFQDSDLYLLDLETMEYRRLDINSDQVESYHSWSSNSRWVVFSSKRKDKLLAKPYFSHVDENGVFSKPLLLPQKNPLFYDSFVKTYNIPELLKEPVRIKARDFVKVVRDMNSRVKATLDPEVELPERDEESDGKDMPWRKASFEQSDKHTGNR